MPAHFLSSMDWSLSFELPLLNYFPGGIFHINCDGRIFIELFVKQAGMGLQQRDTVCLLMRKFLNWVLYWAHFSVHMSTDMTWCWLLWFNCTKFSVDILVPLKIVPVWLLSSQKSGHQFQHLSEFSKLLDYAETVSQQSTLGFLILSLKSEMHLQEFLSCGYFPVGQILSFCDLWSCFSVLDGNFF